MWPDEIVDLAPLIEGVLRLGKIAQDPQREHFGDERAVEALILARLCG